MTTQEGDYGEGHLGVVGEPPGGGRQCPLPAPAIHNRIVGDGAPGCTHRARLIRSHKKAVAAPTLASVAA